MNTEELDVSRDVALRYLRQIEALTEEIEASMAAVGSNELSTFQASVAKQQEICSSLGGSTGQMRVNQEYGRHVSTSGRPGCGFDPALSRQILVAAESLQLLNARYATLLKHCTESVRLFAGLCSSYQEHFEQTAVIAASRSAWSYES